MYVHKSIVLVRHVIYMSRGRQPSWINSSPNPRGPHSWSNLSTRTPRYRHLLPREICNCKRTGQTNLEIPTPTSHFYGVVCCCKPPYSCLPTLRFVYDRQHVCPHRIKQGHSGSQPDACYSVPLADMPLPFEPRTSSSCSGSSQPSEESSCNPGRLLHAKGICF